MQEDQICEADRAMEGVTLWVVDDFVFSNQLFV
jgi:hypothetical protein